MEQDELVSVYSDNFLYWDKVLSLLHNRTFFVTITLNIIRKRFVISYVFIQYDLDHSY